MSTSNSLGVSVGMAAESIASGIFTRLVEFTPNPHTVTEQTFGAPQQVQSPGMLTLFRLRLIERSVSSMEPPRGSTITTASP